MNKSLLELLREAGVTSDTISVLEEELIMTEDIFYSLQDRHFQHMLPKLKIGQHVLLHNIWQKIFKDCDSIKSSDTSSRSTSPEFKSPKLQSSFHGQSTSASSKSGSTSPLRSRSPQSKLKDSNIADLVKAYKAGAISRYNKGCQSTSSKKAENATMMKIILGGMIYDDKKGKGVRRKCLPEPNPVTVDFEKDTTLLAICIKVKELYFSDFKDISENDIKIGDSSGNLCECDYSQKVSEYYAINGFVPSRHKLYTVLSLSDKKSEPSMAIADETVEEQVPIMKEKLPPLVDTEPIICRCVDCGRPFRTYVPESFCNLPDGTSVTYTDPLLLCPLCNPSGFGSFMNVDLFPELKVD